MRLNKKQMFYIPVFIAFIVWSIVYLWVELVVWVLAHFIIFWSLIYVLSFIIHFIFTRRKLNFFNYLDKFALWYSIFVLIFITGVYSFVKYNNDINPAKTWIYEIYNADQDKTVRYISMSHIARKEFYEEVKAELKKASDEWFVLFAEWVRPWTEENLQKFYDIMWIELNNNFYKNLSKVYWLYPQDNGELVAIFWTNFYNIDLSVDDIVEWYEKLPQEIKDKAWELSDVTTDIAKNFSQEMEKLSDKQRNIIAVISRSIINFAFKMIEDEPALWEKEWAINKLILEWRNKILAESITASNHKKIVVTYGSLHYKWTLELLQKKSNNAWEEKLIKYLYPISVKK